MNNLLTQKFPITAIALLFVISMSCSHEPIIEPENPGGSNVHGWEDSTINGDATMTRMVFSVNDSIQVVRQGQTRATTTVAGVTTFDLNDAVTIGITGRGTKDYKVTSILTGALTYNGTATDAYCWQSTSETVSLTAWSYGSTTTTADPDNAVYTLPTDQSVSYGELLYAAASDYDYASYKSGISLTLHHQLARLVINLTHLKTGDLDISEIYIGDGSTATIPTTAKFHKPSTGNIGTWGDIGTEKAQITPKTETANACYSAVMIPTTYAAGQKFIVLKTTDSRTYCYIPDADIVLAAGNQYNYTISVKDLKEVSTLTIGDIDPYTYDGTAKEPHPTVTDGSKTLTEGTDYTLSWSNNTNAGTATVTVTGMGGYYSGTQSKNFTIDPIALTSSDLYFASASESVDYVWELQSVSNALTKPAACTVEYSSGNTAIADVSNTGALTIGGTAGTTTITATATGNYSGTATYTLTATANYATFSYTGGIQSITLPAGTYQLEAWGARGGQYGENNISYWHYGGYGGYAKGNKTISGNTTFYICVGGKGVNGSTSGAGTLGGYNGGGNGGGSGREGSGGGGGGATHIATSTGTLYALLNGTNDEKNSVLIIAGGGGGTGFHQAGGHGGGASGGGTSSSSSSNSNIITLAPTTASSYYQLGKGQNGFTKSSGGYSCGTFGTGGGGGGYYGGKAYQANGVNSDTGGTGGTGYIGGVTEGTQSVGVWYDDGQAKITWVSN